MGQPTADAALISTTITTPTTTSASAPPPSNTTVSDNSPSHLPPEALDLATKLFNLARAGSDPTLSTYLSAGIPANLTNSTGNTLLMLAAYHGHASTVRLLLRHGADPNVVNDRGQSPIAGAVFKGYDEVVEILFREGKADVEGGRPSAVDCARMFKREGILEMLGVRETERGERPWEGVGLVR